MSHQIKEKQMSHDRKSPEIYLIIYLKIQKKQIALGLDINRRFDKATKRTFFNLSFSAAVSMQHHTSNTIKITTKFNSQA